MRFDGFLGNAALRERLSAACAAGKLPHCCAICGPEGSGKHTLARLLAAAMQCQGDGAPCGSCAACKKVFSGNHPDVLFCEDPEHKLFGVDPARRIAADACIRPNEGRSKVYIFPQELGIPAQNALLKLIEEPPAYAAFLFLTPDPERLLPTVRSRCQMFFMTPLDPQELLAALRVRFPDRSEADCQAALSASGGWLGQAISAMEASRLSERTACFARAYADRSAPAMTELLAGMERLSRDEFLRELDGWMHLCHQALRAGAGLPESGQARSLAAARTGPELADAMAHIRKACEYAQSNVGVGHLCGALRVLC